MDIHGIVPARGFAAAGILLLLGGCGVGAASAPSPTATPISFTAATPPCPNPDGGSCLGHLAGGLYRTFSFTPQVTYRVPQGGWTNDDDSLGSFLLVAPGSSLKGVDPGTSDFILVIQGVAATKGCNLDFATGGDWSPAATARSIATTPGLTTSRAAPVTIGGLRGVVLDVRVKKSWHTMCPTNSAAGGGPATMILRGTSGHSDFSWAVDPGSADRVYVLQGPSSALGILVNDAKDGGHLDTYSRIVRSFQLKV